MINRERKINLNKLSEAELTNLETQLGGKIREICDKACQDANKLLNIYGLRTKMQIVVEEDSEQ